MFWVSLVRSPGLSNQWLHNKDLEQDRDWGLQSSYLVDLSPESVLEAFLGLVQGFAVFKGVQVRQHAHDAGKAMHLADVEELKGLHLEAKAGIN